MIETHNVDPIGNPDAWHALRGKDVTASVIGALLDVSPYKTRFALWQEKSGKYAEPFEEGEAVIRGKLLEPVAIELMKLQRPTWRVSQPNVYLRDPTIRMGATPDAYATDPKRKGFGIVQVKSTEKGAFKRNWIGEDGDVEPPLWIVLQAITEAHLAGASWAAVAVLVFDFGLKLELIEVPIHAGIVKRLRDETAAFWRSIDAGDPPPPDYGRDGSLLSGMFSEDNGREIDLTGDNHLPELLDERETIRDRMSTDKARIEAIDAEIVHKMGEHERAFIPGWSLKRPLVARKGFFVEPAEFRRLAIKRLR